jgi:Spy/CpxP family protein refolding chaperone
MSFGVSGTSNPYATLQTDPWSQANGSTSGSGLMRSLSNLNLTESQRSQIRSIMQSARQNGTSQADVQSQIASVLTPTQQATYQSDLQQQAQTTSGTSESQTQSNPFANLNLTAQQQQQISTTLQNAQSQGTDPKELRSQIASVLTPSQQTTFQSDVQNARVRGATTMTAAGSAHRRTPRVRRPGPALP